MDDVLRRLDELQKGMQLLLRQRAPKEWYTTEEVAKLLGKADFTIREWCRLGRIHAQKRACGRGPFKSWKISDEEVTRIANDGLLPQSSNGVPANRRMP